MEGIVGHRQEIENLRQAIREDNISHAYLFQGPEGIGKKKLALQFAKTILCRQGGESACNVCSSCLKMDTGNHPDFSLIGSDTMIKKPEIDAIVEAVKNQPFESRHKVFLIDNAHLMNKEAMNGLLKTLEEAPDFMKLILVSSRPDRLLPTIISRCQDIRFRGLDRGLIEAYLGEKYKIQEDRLRFIARFSKGSLGLAIGLIEEEAYLEIRSRLLEALEGLLAGNKALVFSTAEFLELERERLDYGLDIILYFFRDLALYKALGPSELIVNQDRMEVFSSHENIDFSRIDDIIENIEYTRNNIKNNINFILSIELMLLNIVGG